MATHDINRILAARPVQARYAWLSWDSILAKTLDVAADSEPLRDILDDHGIYDLEVFIEEHERNEKELADAERENNDLREKIARLEDSLRDAIKFMREPLPADEVEAMADDLAGALE